MKKIGRYIIRGLLGRGGMAKVFKVELAPIGKIAALKLFAPNLLLVDLMGIDHLKELFVSEAVALARVQHPHIISIHDFDEDRGNPFFVMDFAAINLGVLMGERYHVEQPSRILDIDKALRYTRQILEGLGCLHDAGIIHRDIKPFNLLVSARDQIKICDFGLTKLRGESYTGPHNLNVGSPYYAAPEQETHPDRAAPTADIYAVGIMLYRMVTGQLPQASIMDQGYLAPSSINPRIDDKWDQFIATAIHPLPTQRFGSALEMRQALQALTSHWEQQKENACALFTEDSAPGPSPDKPHIRRQPIKLKPATGRHQFKVDPLWRPMAYIANDFESRSDTLVVDHATDLIWQQAGCAHPRTWPEAHAYIKQLNEDNLGGYQQWRLPTVEELLTLLRPEGDSKTLCIAPIFDPAQCWIWSTDRRSFVAAYYADINLGFIGWQDFSAPFYVRAVHSLHE